MTRFFLALDINEHDKHTIAMWRDSACITPSTFKHIPPQNYHITLLFLGPLNSSQVNELIQQINPIVASIEQRNLKKLSFDSLGLFKKPQVFYVGNNPIPHWLSHLYTDLLKVSEYLNLSVEKRNYIPHISLFRKATCLLSNNKPPNLTITIKSFSLYQSCRSEHGVKYTAIKTWLL